MLANNREIMRYLMQESYRWIRSQRNQHLLAAKRLEGKDRDRLKKHFRSDTLNRVRLLSVSRIENPPFYTQLARRGMRGLIDFKRMDGITFFDVIILSKTAMQHTCSVHSLLFHEMVHVVQYSFLGTQRFVQHYLTGWFRNGLTYDNIPLEKQAYALQADYEKGKIFSVEQKVGGLFWLI